MSQQNISPEDSSSKDVILEEQRMFTYSIIAFSLIVILFLLLFLDCCFWSRIKYAHNNQQALLRMINHFELLKQELKRTLPIISKKHTILRKQVQKLIQIFQSNIPVFPYEVCSSLLRIFGDSGSSSSCVSIFPFVQTIINLGFGNLKLMDEMLNLMLKMKSMQHFSSQEFQMKLQQLVLLMISKQWISFANMEFVNKLFNMILVLENNKNSLLKKNSIASIIQILVLLMNQTRQSNQNSDSLIRIIKQFLLIADGVRPQWLIEGVVPDKELVVHILSQILQEQVFKDDLQKYEKLLLSIISIITKNLFQLMQSSNQQLSPSKERRQHYMNTHLYLLLYYRILTRTSKILGKQFEFLEEINKNLVHQESFAVRILSHEAISLLFNDHKWLHNLLVSPQCELFFHLISTLVNQAKNICNQKRLDLISPNEGNMRHLMMINDYEIYYPDYTPGFELKMIIKDLQQITFSFYSIYQQIFQISLQKRFVGQVPLHKLFSQYHKGVIEVMKSILPRDISEGLLQSVLKIIEKFINLSGCFGDNKVTGVYVKIICKYCLPTQFVAIDYKHVQINKMVLNIANCLGNLLDTSSWIIIWKALQNYQAYYNKYLLSKETNQYFHQRQNDVQILYQSIDSIFTESVNYQNDYLMIIIDSLIQVTYECLENNFSENDKKIFSFQRIGQIYKLNLSRCCLIWPSLSSSLLCVTTSKVSNFRSAALALLNKLIPLTLSHLSTHPEDLSLKFEKQNYQKLVFEPWINLVKCNFPELKQQISQSLNKILIDYGHILDQGWIHILEIIRQVGDFKSIQVIIETFLDRLSIHLEKLVEIVHQFKKSLKDPNQKYLCLTFLWNIGDYSCTIGRIALLEKIFGILLEPEHPFVFNPEARHSAFYIFTQLLIHNCQNESIQLWNSNFKVIQTYIDYILVELNKVSDPKIVEQAGKNILINLIKIYKKYFLVLQKNNNTTDHQLELFFSFAISIIKLKSIDLYVLTLKQIKQILTIKTEQLLSLPKFKQLLGVLSAAYQVSEDLKVMKCLVSYTPPDVFDILGKCMTKIDLVYDQAYKLVDRIFMIRLEAEAKDVKLIGSRIFFEQKLIMEFMKGLYANTKSNEELFKKFGDDFLTTLKKLLQFQDYYYVGKLILMIKDIVQFLKNQDSINKYIQFLGTIGKLKYNLEVLKKLNLSKQMPVWSTATQQLMKISNAWITLNNFENSIQVLSELKHIQDIAQPNSSNLVETLNQPNIQFYFQNEITLLNYLLHQFILNDKFGIEEKEIEVFANRLYERSKISDAQSNIASYARTNYELLFKVCNNQNRANVINRVAIVYCYLLKRVSDTFELYFEVEKKHGSSINQKFVNQVIFVLTKFQKFKVIENIHKHIKDHQIMTNKLNQKQIRSQNKHLLGEYSHFFYFHNTLSMLIKTKQASIRDILSVIFQSIGNLLLQ